MGIDNLPEKYLFPALSREPQLLKDLITTVIYETLLDAQAIAKWDMQRFRTWHKPKKQPKRKRRIHPNAVIGAARRALKEWVYSERFADYVEAILPEKSTKVLQDTIYLEFAKGNRLDELDAWLAKYRSLKQGHSGKPIRRQENDKEETNSSTTETTEENYRSWIARRTGNTTRLPGRCSKLIE